MIAGLTIERGPAEKSSPGQAEQREAGVEAGELHLVAEAAITSAWHDNHASLGVSRALGYQPNGEMLHAHPGRVDVLKHLRLLRADWLAGGLGDQVEITGADACLPLFGLPQR